MNTVVLLMRYFLLWIFFVLVSNISYAQLCQGSLGDPIVNITFGAGANPGAPLKAATTSYQYVSSDCPGDGFYTVRTNTVNCFGSTWHTVNSDHTGDPNGYFMLINASFQPSAFYLDTVKGLCGGTTYEFAAWVLNVLKPTACSPNPTQPNLTFTIEGTDGTVLQTYNTNTIGSVISPTWQQFGFYFKTPTNVNDVVLRIFNNAPGGCGNDLALDDITFRPCGPQIVSGFAGSNVQSMTMCEGGEKSFSFNGTVSGGFTNPSFIWQQSTDGLVWTDIPLATSTSFSVSFDKTILPGSYFYRLSAAEAGNMNSLQCRIASNSLSVKVAAIPETTTGSNSPVCQNQALLLNASGGSNYFWTGPGNFTEAGANVSIPNVQPSQAGKYFVLVRNDDGCESRDSVTVEVKAAPVAQVLFADTSICEGESVHLFSSGGSLYQWTPGDGLSATDAAATLATPASATTYTVTVSNSDGCSDTAAVLVNVVEAPVADAGPDRWVIEGTTVQLLASATGQDVSYSWSPDVYLDNASSLQPMITPLRDTGYILTVVSNVGCGTDTDSMQVFVYKDVFVPTAFSPNNDGLNDTWNIPVLIAYPEFELTVFNRHGRAVFHARGSNRPWDGRYRGEEQPAGVYVYMLDLKDGSAVRKGTLTLVR